MQFSGESVMLGSLTDKFLFIVEIIHELAVQT